MTESITDPGAKKPFEFGETYVIKPTGPHQATIFSWDGLLGALHLPNIKWICPTAPFQPLTLFRGSPDFAWCDVSELSEDANEDVNGLDATAAHVASLLSAEPPGIKLGVGGFSMGAAAALYTATCFVHGKFRSGNPHPVILSAVVGLSGWLPYLKSISKVEGGEAAQRATSLPILLCHGRGAKKPFEFGETYVIKPTGPHQATIFSWDGLLGALHLPNIKWICPTAPFQPLTLFRGSPDFAWCDVSELSEDANEDVNGLDATAAHVASLLSAEPPGIKLGVGGFSMGAAAALYTATCFVHGKFRSGNPHPVILSAVVGLSGWLPYLKSISKVEGGEAAQRATSLPILLCHGRVDPVVRFTSGQKTSEKLSSCGFQDCTFKAYPVLGHYTLPEELKDVSAWLSSKLGLEGKQ